MAEQFITREAILRDNLSLLGYELKFRSGSMQQREDERLLLESLFADSTTMVFHWESVVGPHLAFLPLSARELLSGGALILPRKRAVIQIPAVEAGTELIECCRDLKASGYRLSIDARHPEFGEFASIADFVRVRLSHIHNLRPNLPVGTAAVHIALDVDSWADHRRARDLGIRHFQGRFFLEPQIFRRKTVSTTEHNALRLLQATLNSPLDLAAVEQIVREEPAITYKLLRYLNSPAMERAVEVRSIRNAISLLGEQEFRRWASIVAVATPASNKPSELMRTALTRAFFCEELGFHLHRRASYDFFFTGLLSVMDAVLDQPLEQIVTELALPDNVRRALCGEPGPLRDALQAALAYEEGEWDIVRDVLGRMTIAESCAPGSYTKANVQANALLA